MGMLRIRCGYCNSSWDVYGMRGQWTDDVNRTCPHCGARIDSQTWQKHVLPAFGALQDANRELFKDHANHLPLFAVDYHEDALFTPDNGDQLQAIADRLEGLEDTLGNMLLGVPEKVLKAGVLSADAWKEGSHGTTGEAAC